MAVVKTIVILIGALFCWENLYFSPGEGIVMSYSLWQTVAFLGDWYIRVNHNTRFFDLRRTRIWLKFLPLTTIVLYLLTLRTLASYDVVGEFYYIIMYLLLGITWLYVSLRGMFLCWSFSYQDDVLMGRNVAALIAFSGAFLGFSLIYAGANIGDGPGWWTVVWAGGLGTVTLLLLGGAVKKCTHLVDSVVMDRDTAGGIRLGCYLLGCGLILARASGGDWTSFSATVKEFMAGWPAAILTVIVIILEHLLFRPRDGWEEVDEGKVRTILVSAFYIIFAVVAVNLLPPLI